MSFKLDRMHVWIGEVEDQAGGVAGKLSILAQTGANLEYINTYRMPGKPGVGVLEIGPVSGPNAIKAARSAGLHETPTPVVIRVEGDNAAGLAHRLTHQWAVEGLTLHSMMMSVLGTKFVGYVAFDNVEDANRAAAILGDLGSVTSAEVKANNSKK